MMKMKKNLLVLMTAVCVILMSSALAYGLEYRIASPVTLAADGTGTVVIQVGAGSENYAGIDIRLLPGNDLTITSVVFSNSSATTSQREPSNDGSWLYSISDNNNRFNGDFTCSVSVKYTGAESSTTLKVLSIQQTQRGEDNTIITPIIDNTERTVTLNMPGTPSQERTATPTFSPNGGSFTTSQAVSISCADAGATIYYTTDGTNPTTASTVYNGAFTISQTTTVKAVAQAEDKLLSNVASATFTKGSGSGTGTGGGGGGGGGGGNNTTTTPTTDIEDEDVPLFSGISFPSFIKGFEDGTFRGNSPITREQFVTILYRLKGGASFTADTANPSFRDVASTRWSFAAIEWAKTRSIAVADASGNFRPSAPLLRSEMAVMIVRCEGLTTMAENSFSDITDHANRDDILRAAHVGILNGYTDGTFRPEGQTTRSEAVKALVCYLLGAEPTSDQQISLTSGMSINFSDLTSGSWANNYITLAVNGYSR